MARYLSFDKHYCQGKKGGAQPHGCGAGRSRRGPCGKEEAAEDCWGDVRRVAEQMMALDPSNDTYVRRHPHYPRGSGRLVRGRSALQLQLGVR